MIRISAFICLMFSTFPIVGFFLPAYLQSKGLDSIQIGIVMACGAVISIIAQPFWGFVSDKRKTVKNVLILLICGNFLAISGFFSMETFIAITMFFTFFMFFNSATGALTETLVISYAHENKVEYGKIRLWGEVGVGLSALLLGILIERLGLGYLWGIYCILLAATILIAISLKDSLSTPVPVDFKALGKLFMQPKLLWFLALIMTVSIPHRMNDILLALYLSELGASESKLGLAWVVATFSTVPALLLVGRLMKRWNEMVILVIAALAYSIRWAVYSMTDDPIVLIAAQALHSVTFPLFLVASIQHLAIIVPGELRASGQAAFAVTFGGLGGMLGSIGGGYAFEQFGAQVSYGIGGGLALLAAVATLITYLVNRHTRNTSKMVDERGVTS
ncbi:MFS transporter [Paenibacillus alkaliterrae]|uniref:MFS transporter n=1 Tax=Paenibacillus alkaliterrae TaxID=320909 RepID=UPI001F1C5964|nr:MFS transporter [Paenibacillus alkaliterrae]MCF2939572.1 MFS transporter [Paenibacillus alkaliterrae]